MDDFGWKFGVVQESDNHVGHIFPVGDSKEHEIARDCWCEPTVGEDGHVYHHAADGREKLQ